MPQAIYESTAFNSRNRKVAIHCVFSVKDNTHIVGDFVIVLCVELHFKPDETEGEGVVETCLIALLDDLIGVL